MNRSFKVTVLLFLLTPLLGRGSCQSFFNVNSAFALLSTDLAAETLDLPIGTCNARTPCPNGACCSGVSGLCGYSPSECGAGNCTSNCNAKAECGEFGTPGKQNCPLGVCCSKFGFCGSTKDFCDIDAGCQGGFGGCGDVQRPTCSKDAGSVSGRSIGYYETWANTRPCSSVSPEDLNVDGLTHVNFAFVFFDPGTFQIIPMDSNAGSLLSRFTAIKERKPGLQTWVSVGGWSFNDPGPYQKAFSDMAMTAANRRRFIDGLITFMETYGFDGMDLDWEYPTADDRGGRPEDQENFVLLSEDIRKAFGTKYGYSITLPASYWYLQHFRLAEHQKYVNWFNLMSYDLHGVWDAASKFIGPYVAPHTNITEIDQGLDLLWRAGVKPENVVLGQGLYGRSFTLSDPTCNVSDGKCTFTGGAKPGACSQASGILNLQEIIDIIDEKGLEPTYDEPSGVKWINWDNDQWVSYDDEQTLNQKREFANSRCLGGMMLWALDQVDQQKSYARPPGMTEDEAAESEYVAQDEAAKGVCYTTFCDEGCRNGDHEVSQMNGQPGAISTMERCAAGQYRRLCCSKGSTMGECRWRGFRGLGLSCLGGCAEGEIQISQNTNHRSDKEDQSCTGGTQSYCCSRFKPPLSREQVEEKFEDEAADAALGAAIDVGTELAAKAFCRAAITAALTPLGFIPFIGWILRLAAQAAVPTLANVCAKGIAKGGKSAFKFKGKDYEVKLDKPLDVKNDRPPQRDRDRPESRDEKCNKPKLAKRLRAQTNTEYASRDPVFRTSTKTCDGTNWEQACLNYKSVIDKGRVRALMTCPGTTVLGDIRPWVRTWNRQHDNAWVARIGLDCERDEWPPARIMQGQGQQWIRLIPAGQNSGAGRLIRGVCPDKEAEREVGRSPARQVQDEGGCRDRATYVVTVTTQVTKQLLSIEFRGVNAGGDYGISANPCWPRGIAEPGFALLTDDDYYDDVPIAVLSTTSLYANPPMRRRRAKRGSFFDMEEVPLLDGPAASNTTDVAAEETWDGVVDIPCEEDNCIKEMEELGILSLPHANTGLKTPKTVDAVQTSSASWSTVRTIAMASATVTGAVGVATMV
ncbi:hypothetical protein BDZ85DRAFT_239225 [Elsinoe ampelina]|uniref:chitinase n=1 Tax=Elsinoe ampelina TaxID=302913 RepID=A0A6A6G972_9PEZI|nr:hypothetical protein BDZ85DRAFT_239225 [Elsinoe ampelina]